MHGLAYSVFSVALWLTYLGWKTTTSLRSGGDVLCDCVGEPDSDEDSDGPCSKVVTALWCLKHHTVKSLTIRTLVMTVTMLWQRHR